MIRKATIDDLDNLMPLCKEHFYACSLDDWFTYDDESSRIGMCKYLTSDGYLVLVNETNNNIDGVIAYLAMESPYNKDERIVSELLWYAKSGKVFLQLHKKINDIISLSFKSYIINLGVPINNSVKDYLDKDGYTKRNLLFSKKVGI